jgi:hypothetical protein
LYNEHIFANSNLTNLSENTIISLGAERKQVSAVPALTEPTIQHDALLADLLDLLFFEVDLSFLINDLRESL